MSTKKEIFEQIKYLMKKYESPLIARCDYESHNELWSEKEIEVDGRKKKGCI